MDKIDRRTLKKRSSSIDSVIEEFKKRFIPEVLKGNLKRSELIRDLCVKHKANYSSVCSRIYEGQIIEKISRI